MNSYILKNNELSLSINELGAELSSIKDNRTQIEYLWNADPTYWKRHSPILFPIVGSLQDQTYLYNNKSYSMSQHGFARDMEFNLLSKTDTEIWLRLDATNDTMLIYPFQFSLELVYQLVGRKIIVMWRVINQDTSKIYFSIGGHPAFMCPLNEEGKQTEYFISFDDADKPIHYLTIDEHGLAVKKTYEEQSILNINNGILPIDSHLFDQDALIIENNQSKSVSLLTPDKKPYLTVSFDAPLFGLWSPAKKNAPFICIEPWYGRCDSSEFHGTLEDREWGNTLEAGKQFSAAYTIEIK